MKLSRTKILSPYVRARTHQGRQWTQTLRTLTVLELEHLGLNDKTIDGLIRSVLRNGRQGPDRESFGAELSAACMTAMISGPRCGSTSELQRAADATPFRARRQYTPPFPLFPEQEKKIFTHSKEGPARFRIKCLHRGNTCRSSVLYRAKRDNATWGVVREQWQVPPHFLRPALRHHAQARGPAMIPSTKSRPPIGQHKRIPQNDLEPRTTILHPKGMVALTDNMIIELLFVQSRPFSVCPTWA